MEMNDYSDEEDDDDDEVARPWRDVKHDSKTMATEGQFLQKAGNIKQAIKRYNQVGNGLDYVVI